MKPRQTTAFKFRVRTHDAFLATRDRGKLVLRDFEDQMPADAQAVDIDFTDVVAITHSFADEFLGQYYSSLTTHDAPPATVTLTALSPDVRETIIVCFERRDLIALERQDDHLGLLAASDMLIQTYLLAQTLRHFTAVKLAEQLHITAPNANNRLKRLTAARALIRQLRSSERGGKEFTYTVPA